MTKKFIPCFLLIVFFELASFSTAYAGGNTAGTDTLPAVNKNQEQPASKKDEAIIKEVPKARKQEKPVAVVTIPVKPVIIKPKIVIKPIIRIH